jgi:FKBP-type peptidyl-prolyl cis-trans isomerase SlyD
MKISKNTVASIYYTLKATDSDKVIEQIPEDAPHEFLFGHELMLPDFEAELEGLEAGDHFTFAIACDDAYGPVDPHAIFDLPLDTFEEDGKIDYEAVKPGNSFPMEDDMGNRHIGKIIRVMKESVTMDFNHPLAGKDIIFTGKVLSVRKAESNDLASIVN